MRKILITGSQGFLGSYIVRSFPERFEVIQAYRKRILAGAQGSLVQMDIERPDRVQSVFAEHRPDTVIHLAGIKDLPVCEKEPERTLRLNVEGTVNITAACLDHDAFLIFMSTDYVFRGDRGSYSQTDLRVPTTVYGRSKRDAEDLIIESGVPCSICRSGGVYANRHRQSTLLSWAGDTLEKGAKIDAFSNIYNSPTCILDLTRSLRHLAESRQSGTFHVAGTRMSRWEFLSAFAEARGHAREQIRPQPYEPPAEDRKLSRPFDLSLDTRDTRRQLGFDFLSVAEGFNALQPDL